MSDDPIVLDDLERGDTEIITVSDLLDRTGELTVFGASDVLRWTAKRSVFDDDTAALFTKVSPSGIVFTPGGSTATITIHPADYPATPAEIPFVWDLQLTIGGDVTNVQTIAHGTGRVVGDVSVTAP